ncbi:MAG: spore maturation protein, partial [Thermoanaerobacteraceae bacterium]|nr:spore maturation protein [Thermoanaerobacteraceae bacterium]
MSDFSKYIIPLLVLIIPFIGLMRGVKVYEVFIEGARDGLKTTVNILPYLIAMLVAVNMFKVSGAMDMIVNAFGRFTSMIGLPAEVLPLAILRPLSGSASLGIATGLIREYGPDSYIGVLSSMIYGSSEATLYVLSVYFGAVGIKRMRYALLAGLTSDAIGI